MRDGRKRSELANLPPRAKACNGRKTIVGADAHIRAQRPATESGVCVLLLGCIAGSAYSALHHRSTQKKRAGSIAYARTEPDHTICTRTGADSGRAAPQARADR